MKRKLSSILRTSARPLPKSGPQTTAPTLILLIPELGPWIWRRRHIWSWRGTVYETRERIAFVRAGPTDVKPDPSDSLLFGGVEQGFETRWWRLEELEATRDRLSPRRFPELLRELLEHGPPAESFDVGV